MGIRRVALKPHAASIRRWVEAGRSDVWIAKELKTSSSSVQSFRSRNAIYRRDPVRRGHTVEHPVVLEVTEDTIVLKTEAINSELFEKEWRPYPRGASDELRLIVTPDRIYVERFR